MPFGRENHIIALQNEFIHNWSDEKEFKRIDAGSADVIDVIEPQFSMERIPLNDQDYQRYFLHELGLSDGDDVEEVLQELSTDPSSRAKLQGLQAKLEKREELHSTFPMYEWVVGNSRNLCFGIPSADRSVTRVECTDLNGKVRNSGTIDASVKIPGLQGHYLYGTRTLEQ